MTTKKPEAAIDQAIEDLTLLLIYLSSWEEQVVADMTVYRAWKGYLFETLNDLEEAGYLDQTRRAKSVTLTGSGLERARALAVQYFGEEAEDW